MANVKNVGGAYSDNYLYQGNYYVHYHAKHIGMAMNGSPVPPDELVNTFKKSKQQAFQASKTQYKRLFFDSLSKQSQQLLNETLNNDNNQVFRELQTQIGRKFEQALSVDKMTQLLRITKKTAPYLIKDAMSKSKTHVESFNKLLQNFSEAASLLQGKAGANLMLALNHSSFSSGQSFSMGNYLLKAMEDFKKRNDKSLLTELEVQQSQQVIQTFNALGRALKNQQTSTGKTLTSKAAQRMIDSIFNTGFAESISAQLKETAYINLANNFKSALTGSKTVQIQFSDELGQYLGKSKGQASAGKADAMFNNVQVSLSSGQTISLDIGISDKLYKANKIQDLEKKVTGVYSSGSGGSLLEAIESSFHSNQMRYLAINTIGHGHSEWSIAQQALNEVLLTRQIVRLFSSRGGSSDFAQFMFVNGRIVPIYEIIMSTLEDISLSSSLGGQKTQPVTLSISGRDIIQKETHQRQQELGTRISNIANALNRSKIIAHVNMNKINYK